MKQVILALTLFIFAGCAEIQLGDTDIGKIRTKYHIVKGTHGMTLKLQSSTSYVYFEADLSGAVYDNKALGLDSLDWNKLYGFRAIKVHDNSYRIGFRLNGSMWEFCAYSYVDGKRQEFEYLGSCEINGKPQFIIDLSDNSCYYEMVGVSSVITNGNKPKHLFKSFPYFGGNRKAPNSIDIWIKEL